MKRFFTSESVTEGHPDKICDQIADGILDTLINDDPFSRVACEVTAGPNQINIMGEITSNAKVDYEGITRNVVRNIGYVEPNKGFDADTCKINVNIHQQSEDISIGVESALEVKEGLIKTEENGAGDQGMMFGFACNETDELMPLPITLAHALTKRLTDMRKYGCLPYLRPDGKAQVTVEYRDGKPSRIDTIVIAAQHTANIALDKLRCDIKEYIVKSIFPSTLWMKIRRYTSIQPDAL
jgi:S-adenosylmethionine synthetase